MEELNDVEAFQNCWLCGGNGYTLEDGSRSQCRACGGFGKLDWISNLLRKERVRQFTGYSGCISPSFHVAPVHHKLG